MTHVQQHLALRYPLHAGTGIQEYGAPNRATARLLALETDLSENGRNILLTLEYRSRTPADAPARLRVALAPPTAALLARILDSLTETA